jgi:predicted phage tail protein
VDIGRLARRQHRRRGVDAREWQSFREKAMSSNFTSAAAAAAVAAFLAVAGAVAIFWNGLGVSQISLAGWLAMIFGVIITLALGIGLMALMFISSRRGYDKAGREDC